MLFNEPKLLKWLLYFLATSITPCFSALQRAEIAEIHHLLQPALRFVFVSVLFNEPKLLKFQRAVVGVRRHTCVSVLFNEPKLLKYPTATSRRCAYGVSVLFNEPKLLKSRGRGEDEIRERVSVLFNEPKLLKFCAITRSYGSPNGFSALQRAEIAEIPVNVPNVSVYALFQCSSTSRNC